MYVRVEVSLGVQMPNIAKILKDEITRVSRREIRLHLEQTRRLVTHHKREIAALKAQLKALERNVSALAKRKLDSEPASPEAMPARKVRFVPKGLVSTRRRLSISAADLARLMGVTDQTIYNWENGVSRPRPEHQARLLSLRDVGKRQLQKHLAEMRS